MKRSVSAWPNLMTEQTFDMKDGSALMEQQAAPGYQLSQQQLDVWRELTAQAEATPREVCEILLSGEVESEVLRRVLEEMVAKHEILRTGYRLSAGMSQPWQVVSESCALAWREEREAVEAGDPSRNDRAIEAMAEAAVDCSEPALHACLQHREGREPRLLLSLPRLSVDRKCWANLTEELARKYERLREGGKEREEAEAEVVQYAAYAEWQRELEESEEASEGRAYWRGQSMSAEADGLLTIEREDPECERECGTERVRVGDELATALASLTERLGVSEEAALLACWYALLWKLTEGRRQSVVVWFDGRADAELEGSLGVFEHWLPMRFETRGETTLRGLVSETSGRLEEHRMWQDCYQRKLEASVREETERQSRLVFGFEYAHAEEERSSSLVWRECGKRVKDGGGQLRLLCGRRGVEFRAELQFDLSNYKREAVERLAEGYLELVKSGAERPEAAVRELSLVSPRERRQLLEEWNATRREYPRERCIHQLFKEQVERTPGAVALIYQTERLTYRELNGRANQLAHYLRGLGVGAETLVGLCVERSLEMIVGLLGILKAGGAYLPLDPESPAERLALMLENAGAGVVLTLKESAKRLPPFEGRTVLLDEDWERIAEESQREPESEVEGKNLAYVIYTSGSTGRPKGVMVEHRNLVNYTLEICRQLGLLGDGGERGLQFATVSTIMADLGNTCIYPSLVSGGCLHVLSYEAATDGDRYQQYVEENPIDVLKIVPSHLRALLDTDARGARMLPRRYLIMGGEALSYELVARIEEREEGCRVINHYGPTETTVGSLTAPVTDRGAARKSATAPIGRPIGNTRSYILDQEMRLAPTGMLGELYIGGEGVARGYRGKPELTAERFIPNEFSPEGGERLYRTGDVCRYLPDGRLEFIGRADDQVKVRGYRIEPGEVAAVLNGHAMVKQSVIVGREDERGNKRLIGYVVGSEDVRAAELKRYIRERLPEYMVPDAIVVMEELPLTANGKIDRGALPEPGMGQAGADETRALPRTPTEELLCGIWQAVLGVDSIAINDNFFDMGGHSLMATTVIGRIRKTFQIETPVSRLFERPTVSMLASSIDEEIRAGHGLHTPPIVPVPRYGELPLSFAQQRLWFIDQLSPGNVSNNISGGIRLTGALKVEALDRSLSEIIKRHESLRTKLVGKRGIPMQVIDRPGRWALPVEDLSDLSEVEVEAEIQRQAAADADQPFNLSLGPLLRVKLFRLRSDEHALLVTIHHIISDRWSLGVFRQELAALYEAFCERRPSPLPELPIQYCDYAVWQRTQLQGEELERLVRYWKRQLEGASPVLELPSDRARPEKRRFRGDVRSVAMSKDLTDAVKKLGRDENATLFMTLLAAFNVLLYHYSGQEDIVVGTDVANRNQIETENLIGFFVNQLVLRTDLSGNPAFREILRRVREVALEAYTHQELPFDKLVEMLKPERSLKYSPIFQVKLVLQNAPMPPLELVNLSLAEYPLKSSVSRLDLTLLFWEEGDGLRGLIEYDTDLFDAASIIRLSELFERILQFVIGQPQATMAEIKQAIDAFERERLRADARLRSENNFKRFQAAKPRVVKLAGEKVVRAGLLHPDLPAPLVIEPMLNDADLIDWSRNNCELIDRELSKHGALLFRGFNLASAGEFGQFAKTICPELFDDNGEHQRQAVGSGVYTPVFYPPDKKLLWHNENSFNLQWPMKIWFCCSKPPDRGGETPIVDSRKVFESISPGTRERFIRKGVMYVRNYGESLGLSWQKVFRTTSKTEVEDRCRKEKIHFEWKDGGRLVTRAIRPAVGKHPRTGEMVWFNQAQHWHLSCLDQTTRESLQALFKEEDLPRNCYYGDGSHIDDSEMKEILEVYRRLEISFPWQRWDTLMLDNMLMAHGRNSFVGERKLLVAMGEMFNYSQI
jgi:amino acid adenylation domain-containing protein